MWLALVLVAPGLLVTALIVYFATAPDRAAGDWRATIGFTVGALSAAAALAIPIALNVENAAIPIGGMLAGIALGFVVFRLLPRPDLRVRPEVALPAGTDGSRVIATGTARAGRTALIVGWVTGIALAISIVALVLADPSLWWAGALLALTGLALPLIMQPWTVTVTPERVRTATTIPFLSFTHPMSEIASASVRRVDPFGDFGGWGYRANLSGERGVVLFKGDALVLHLAGKRRFVVTTNEAAALASAIASVLDSSPSGQASPQN